MTQRSLHLYAPFQADDVLPDIQALRADCFVADGAIEPCERYSVPSDFSDWHIVQIVDGKVVGCISAIVTDHGDIKTAFVHSWALDLAHRKTRAGIELALSCFALADLLGIHSGRAYATERNGSGMILEKLGGTAGEWHYSFPYDCNMRDVWFNPKLLSAKHRDETDRIKRRLTQSQIERV